jgi:acyl-[acyl-carrier-protein] desaturase
MSVSPRLKERVYRAYMEFFDAAEQKRRWNPFRDIPWERAGSFQHTEEDAIKAETFCGVELYVPDYTANGFNLTRPIFGQAWFQASWGYEESKHALTFRNYLLHSGLRSEEQYQAFEDRILARVWNLPFHTRRQMTCYGALQESATYLIYRAQREDARQRGNELLEQIYFYVSRDEAAHMGFYCTVLEFEMEEDRAGTIADLAHVVRHFQMPGLGLIPEYDERMRTDGVGITSATFLERGVFPLLKRLGTSRPELVAEWKRKARAGAAQASERPWVDAAAGGP